MLEMLEILLREERLDRAERLEREERAGVVETEEGEWRTGEPGDRLREERSQWMTVKMHKGEISPMPIGRGWVSCGDGSIEEEEEEVGGGREEEEEDVVVVVVVDVVDGDVIDAADVDDDVSFGALGVLDAREADDSNSGGRSICWLNNASSRGIRGSIV